MQASRNVSRGFTSLVVSCLLCLALIGCASWQAPIVIDDSALRERAVTATLRDVQVSAAVLSIEDNQKFFGANINDTGVQSVWVEIVNNSAHTLWLLQSGTDPDYFSPLEVAWSLHKPFSPGSNSKIDDHFDGLSFKNPIPPGETRSGILYTNPHHGTRILNIDLLGQQTIFPFTLFPPVPEDIDRKKMIEISARFAESRNNDYQDESAFRTVLEQLSCCANDTRNSIAGDPINVIIIGELADLGAALIRRGFRRDSQPLDKTQQVFGRQPDVVLRKAGQGGVPANWMRLWVVPFRYQGQPVMLVQSGRPVGGRFRSIDHGKPILHPDVDETRSLVIQDMLYSGGLAKLGFVEGVNPVTVEQRSNHPDKFAYHSDGLRAVLFFVTRPLSLSDVKILDWVPVLERQAAEAAKNNLKEKTNAQHAP
ncbi:MAG: hypothetical protein GY807_09090 [Gammaproteobacteria bacterium]|nr:hypothetical protein [Gammaproteobacteria bacterium]